jgi:hypothetical protein
MRRSRERSGDKHIDGQARGETGNGAMMVRRKEVDADVGESGQVVGDEVAGFGGNDMTMPASQGEGKGSYE